MSGAFCVPYKAARLFLGDNTHSRPGHSANRPRNNKPAKPAGSGTFGYRIATSRQRDKQPTRSRQNQNTHPQIPFPYRAPYWRLLN